MGLALSTWPRVTVANDALEYELRLLGGIVAPSHTMSLTVVIL